MSEDNMERREIPLIEKLIAAFGLLLVLLVAGALVYEAVTHRGGPPDIDVHVTDVRHVNNGYLVRFKALNRGESTAAQVRVRGELRKGDEVVEQGDTVLTYVPDGGSHEGGMFFERDPEQHEVRLRATSYEKP